MHIDNRLQEWELFTLQGNGCYHDQDYHAALIWFRKSAVLMDDVITTRSSLTCQFFRAFVVSCQNVAFIAEKLGKRQLTEHFYRYSYLRLERLLEERPRLIKHRKSIETEVACARRKYQEHLISVSANALKREHRNCLSSWFKSPVTHAIGNSESHTRVSYLFY